MREPLRELRELRDAGLLPEIEYRDGARPSLLVERLQRLLCMYTLHQPRRWLSETLDVSAVLRAAVRVVMGLPLPSMHEGAPLYTTATIQQGGQASASNIRLVQPPPPLSPLVHQPESRATESQQLKESPPRRQQVSPRPSSRPVRPAAQSSLVSEAVPPQRQVSQDFKADSSRSNQAIAAVFQGKLTVASRGLKVPRAPVTERWPEPMVLPYVGLGTWLISGDEMADIVHSAYEAGYRHFDTADIMHGPDVEFCMFNKQIGQGLAGKPRSSYHINSKLNGWNHSPEKVRPSIERTLDELGLVGDDRYLDCYYLHFVSVWEENTAPFPMSQKDDCVLTDIPFDETW